jgi:predicted nucleic acid-binding Zn ribbon protein
LMFAQPEEFGSKLFADKNDGLTLHFHDNERSWIASNVGDMELLVRYDVRPSAGHYKFVDGRYIPHPSGDVKIEGYYPNYRIAGLFIPVYIGPHLYFYPEPQQDIIKLANSGKLRELDVFTVRRCLTCEREIPRHLGPRAKYCSVECGLVTRDMLRKQRAANAQVRKFSLPKVRPIRKCEKCDAVIPKSAGPRARFCSVECGLVTRNMLAAGKKYICEACGTPFTRYGRQRFCSEECKPMEKKIHHCDYCGKGFSRYGRQRFCSEECKLRSKLDALR